MRYISLIITALSLAACNTGQQAAQSQAAAFELTEQNMLNKDTVLLFAGEGAKSTNQADKIFLQAIETFRNKKDAAASLKHFKASILLAPQAKTYYEFGNALLDVKQYKSAIAAYNIAEALGYKPLSKLFYNTACAYSLEDNEDSAYHYLVAAIEFGYTNTKQIFEDNDLKTLRETSYNFAGRIQQALSGAGDPERLSWNIFARQFQPIEFPTELNEKYAEKIELQDIPYDFERFIPEMRDNKFSRETGMEFYYVGKVKDDANFKTLCYAVRNVMLDHAAPPYYFAVSFNNEGKLIEKLLIGGRLLMDDVFREATFRENGEIEVKKFAVRYEKDPADAGFENNALAEKNQVGVEVYAINEEGRFVTKSMPLAVK
ncbi:hypothetical protein [Chitinophaga sp. YIM B06452]|uniref:TPR end-of-group domain-containing protein n=1 Tax=Chitinophaga sp. YIM B06452 TaxID=3082158 RepID=UPI0031FE4CD8